MSGHQMLLFMECKYSINFKKIWGGGLQNWKFASDLKWNYPLVSVYLKVFENEIRAKSES